MGTVPPRSRTAAARPSEENPDMRCARLWLVGLGVLAAAAASLPARAGDPPRTPALSAGKLAERIDELIDAKLKAQGVTPAPAADDAEFLRRLSLDVGG